MHTVSEEQMTISPEMRRQNMNLALRKMSERLGEDFFDNGGFADTDPYFSEVLPTAWEELKDEGLVIEVQACMGEHARYMLTGLGWIEAIRLTGKLEDPVFRQQVIDFKTRLKAFVKGRQREATVSIPEFSRDFGIPQQWICNIIESGLLSRLFPSELVDLGWVDGCPRFAFEVSRSFGMKRL
jgi:hypothetical protein